MHGIDFKRYWNRSRNTRISDLAAPAVETLVSDGIQAMYPRNYRKVEILFSSAFELVLEDSTTIYNLCVIWMERDGIVGFRKARTRLEQLHPDFPDYGFAPIALANFATIDGDFEKARKLLAIA